MIIDPETYRAASLLVERHGRHALTMAAGRSKALLARDDLEEFAVWERITVATAELLRTEPAENEPVH